MTSDRSSADARVECEMRIARLEQQMRYLWWPGRRSRLINECYDTGYVARQIGASDLAEKGFRTAIALVDGRQPCHTKGSLATFSTVAACHNHLGLQYFDDGKFADAATSFDSAIGIREELRRLFPKDRENEVYLGGSLCNRGHASAGSNPEMARDFYERSLAILRQPTQTCECSYWDEKRQSWWCEQLEALGQALNQQWIALAPCFIDNAQEGLLSLQRLSTTDDDTTNGQIG